MGGAALLEFTRAVDRRGVCFENVRLRVGVLCPHRHMLRHGHMPRVKVRAETGMLRVRHTPRQTDFSHPTLDIRLGGGAKASKL